MLPNKLKESYQLLKSKCNEIKLFLDKPKWKNRLLYYFIILLPLAALAWLLWNTNFTHTLWTNNAYTQYNTTQLNNMGFFDNERYLLSALVQSLAATIALVITLSLVAVQLAAQSYSARVIDVYKKNPDMWILLCIYIFTIFYGLGLTKIIGLGILGNYMEGAIFVAYFMGFFAFICLVPYILKTLDLLKPSTVITLLAEEITKEKIIDSLKDDGKIVERDPIQPIIDMISVSIGKNDFETVRNGLYAIKNSTYTLFNNIIGNQTDEDKISSHIMAHLEFTGIHTININNEEMAKLVINSLEDIGKKTIHLKLNRAEDKIVIALINIGRKSTDNELDLTMVRTISSLYNLGDYKLNQNIENTETRIFESIENLGLYTANLNQRNGLRKSIETLKALQTKANKQQNENIVTIILTKLDNLERKSKEKKWSFIPTSN